MLVDYSGSISASELARYGNVVKNDVFAQLHSDDAFSVYPIDAGATTEDMRLASIDLAGEQFSKPSDGITHKSDSASARLEGFLRSKGDSVQHLIQTAKNDRKRYSGNTDILGALEEVSNRLEHSAEPGLWRKLASVFEGDPITDVRNVVVICSDMINEGEDANFLKSRPTPDRNSRLIRDLKSSGKLPDLGGVSVFVMGRTGQSSQEVDAIKAFWVEYFHQSGARLVAYDFDVGPSLKDFFRSSP